MLSWLACCWPSLATAAGTCPVFLSSANFSWRQASPPRARLVAFRAESQNGRLSWEKIPLSVDPLDEDGHVIFRDPSDTLWREALSPHDRLVVDSGDFGERMPEGNSVPCKATDVFELSLVGGTTPRFAYVAACQGMMARFDQQPEGFRHDARNHYVQSPAYTYRYATRNHLMFDSVSVHTAGSEILTSEFSDQLMHLDVRNFFNLRFSADDVQAEMKHERYTPLGLLAQLRFFIKVLFFKVSLELEPEAHFFRNSVFVPMVMTLPMAAEKHVNFGSGIYYTWRSLPRVRWRFDTNLIPVLERPVTSMDPSRLAAIGKRYCQGDRCLFRLRGDADGVPVEMSFALRASLVEKGFFPLAISDSEAYEKNWGKRISRFEGRRMGFYFDCSRLEKGSHEWEFWLKSAGERGTDMPDCPMAASVRRLSAPVLK